MRTQEEYRTRVLGDDAIFAANGFIDTTSECVMTAANGMELVRAKKERNRTRWEAQKQKDVRRAATEEKSNRCAKVRHWCAKGRTEAHGGAWWAASERVCRRCEDAASSGCSAANHGETDS